jgi:hypothetical protein
MVTLDLNYYKTKEGLQRVTEVGKLEIVKFHEQKKTP